MQQSQDPMLGSRRDMPRYAYLQGSQPAFRQCERKDASGPHL